VVGRALGGPDEEVVRFNGVTATIVAKERLRGLILRCVHEVSFTRKSLTSIASAEL